ncbi:uncharacterized protein LOC116172561 [Photinus pyralis]|uniref:uncharacterized protein LOC116172561 n=1 Tax=Photinus pyralis TaxID=7054 RepID=UPI00126730F5|nr:uncharacterized protein LOC116172561 [Photinus pyralis]
MHSSSVLVLVLLGAAWVNAQILSKLTLCSQSDPKFKECLKDAIPKGLALLGAGVPELNIPPIDPMKMDKWEVTAEGPLTFPQTYTNIDIHGHTKGKVKDLDITLTDTDFFLSIDLVCDEVDYQADYVYENAILDGVDYSSKGKTSTMAFNYDSRNNFTGTIIKKDGENYISITKVDVESLGVDDMKFKIDSDDPEVGKKMAKLFNEKWRDMIKETKPKYTKIYAEIYKNEANAFFSKFPVNQIFPK